MIEWELWFADGSRLNSSEGVWPTAEEARSRGGVLVVRVWNHPSFGKVVNWDNGGFYGHPDSMIVEGRVSDQEFARILAEAQAVRTAPSER